MTESGRSTYVQRMFLPLAMSAIFFAASGVLMFLVLFGYHSSALKVIFGAPVIALLIFPLLIPIARIEFDRTGVQLVSSRMLGLWEATSYRFKYDEIDKAECSRYPFTFKATEIGVIIHSSNRRIVAGSIFSMADRTRMASLLSDLSREYHFEFVDEVGLSES